MSDTLAAPLSDTPAAPLSDTLAAARLARLRETLASAPFDAYLATASENVHYATGYRAVGASIWRTHQMAALVTGDDLWLVCPAADTAPAVDAGVPADRIVGFGTFYFEGAEGTPLDGMAGRHASFDEALAVALRTLPPGTRVGSDAAHADFVDASAWALGVRSRKLPGEVDLLRFAARATEDAIHRGIDRAGAGSTERDIAAVIAASMAGAGLEPKFVVVTSGERSALADAYPTDRPWNPGELLRFDVGGIYHGYWSDLGRTAVLGEPDAQQAELYEAVLAAEDEQLALIAPGVPASRVFDVAIERVRDAGVRYRRHHAGHCIGLSPYEPPIVSPGVETLLEQDMTMCVEPPYYRLGWGGMMVEDTIVVTADGCERLSVSDRSLRVVEA
jgi:Xaa-Pro aminopeptidase